MSNIYSKELTCINCRKKVKVTYTDEQAKLWNSSKRPNIQDIFPEWTPEQREMMISGICQECWDALFSEE